MPMNGMAIRMISGFVGAEECLSEQQCHDRLSADEHQEDCRQSDAADQRGAAKHQLPRLFGREVHAHHFGVEGLAEQVGGFGSAVGEVRRDPEQCGPGGPEQTTDDQPPDGSPHRLHAALSG